MRIMFIHWKNKRFQKKLFIMAKKGHAISTAINFMT